MEQLKIDPEFRDKIPPLTEAEYEQLKENVLTAGEVYEPIVVWRGTIIDGHNRWRIIQENPGVSYRVRAMDFPDKWAAFEWIYKNQLGRRNLNDFQREMLIGQMYEAAKKAHGGDRGNQYTKEKVAKPQNEVLPKSPPNNSTSRKVAAQIGVGKSRVERAGDFTRGISEMRKQGENGKEAAEKILSGKAQISRQTVRDFSKMEPERQRKVVESVLTNKPAKPRPVPAPKPKPPGNEGKEKPLSMKARIAQAVADLKNPDKVSGYGVEDFTQELQCSVTMFAEAFEGSITRRKGLFAPADVKKAVCGVLDGLKKTIKKWEENL